VKAVSSTRESHTKYLSEKNLKCRRCDTQQVANTKVIGCNETHQAKFFTCLSCKSLNFELIEDGLEGTGGKLGTHKFYYKVLVQFPSSKRRFKVPDACPENVSRDYSEAAKLLPISPMASAAFARRCLQALLRIRGYTQKDLAPQIKALLEEKDPSKILPFYIGKSIDAVRNFGNFSAHEIKHRDTAAILEVEPGEAEWSIEILEQLIDYYYVKLVEENRKLEALNKKLTSAGKPPIFQPKPTDEESE
jgi:Domain of unknown function (DUF4145)